MTALSAELAAWPMVLAFLVLYTFGVVAPLLAFAWKLLRATYVALFVTDNIPLALADMLFWFILLMLWMIVAYAVTYGVVIWPLL